MGCPTAMEGPGAATVGEGEGAVDRAVEASKPGGPDPEEAAVPADVVEWAGESSTRVAEPEGAGPGDEGPAGAAGSLEVGTAAASDGVDAAGVEAKGVGGPRRPRRGAGSPERGWGSGWSTEPTSSGGGVVAVDDPAACTKGNCVSSKLT